MKKILVIHSSGVMSGAEVLSKDIYENLKDKYSFYFFIPELESKSKFACDSTIFYPKKDNLFNRIKTLKIYIKNIKPEIIQAHGTRAAFLVKILLLTTRKNFKFIYTIHGFHIAHRKGIIPKIMLFVENLTNFLFVDYLIAVGVDDYNIIRKNSWSKKDIFLIKNGVNSPTQKIDREIEKIRNQTKFLILTICRLHYQKDVQTLIKAFNNLDKNIKLVIIGDGPERKSLEVLASKNRDNIIFLGNKENASSLIHYFDAFVLSTHWEGLPLVILEAMLSKVLVIGSDVHGVSELIEDNETGILFKEGNILELKGKIINILENKEKFGPLKEKAFCIAENEYSIKKMIENYENLYNN